MLFLNLHCHALVLDGVFADDGSGGLRFQPASPPTDAEMDHVLGTIERRLGRLLARRGLTGGAVGNSGPDRWAEEAPVLAGIAGASVHGRVALGPRAGAEIRRCGASPELLALSTAALGPCHAHQNGCDLHAGVVVPATDRARLERVCRSALRPPVAHDRIHVTREGPVRLVLRHRGADGTTHVVLDPIELLERLAALTPRPRITLVLYYGGLGAHAAWRSRIRGGPGRSSVPARSLPCRRRTPSQMWRRRACHVRDRICSGRSEWPGASDSMCSPAPGAAGVSDSSRLSTTRR